MNAIVWLAMECILYHELISLVKKVYIYIKLCFTIGVDVKGRWKKTNSKCEQTYSNNQQENAGLTFYESEII